MRPESTRLRGHVRDGRFSPILQQSLGRVAEILARRLLVREGFEVGRFSRHVSPYVSGLRRSSRIGSGKRQELWDQLLEDHGRLFGDPRVREFVDDLVEYRISRRESLDIGASIDLIAGREGRILLVEVKSSNARLEPHQLKALEMARRHGIETGIMRVKFRVSFDHAELYQVRTNQDARIVSNMPNDTLNV